MGANGGEVTGTMTADGTVGNTPGEDPEQSVNPWTSSRQTIACVVVLVMRFAHGSERSGLTLHGNRGRPSVTVDPPHEALTSPLL